MDDYIKDLIKKIEKEKKDCSFEVLWLNDKLIIFANRGSTVNDIKNKIEKKIQKKFSHTIECINSATAYVVPIR